MARRGVAVPMGSEDDHMLQGLPIDVGPGLPVRHLQVYEALGSTNEHALEDGREGLVVVAKEQTAGRGRHGNEWSSPPGGVYLSYLPPKELVPQRPSDLSLIACLAVVDVVETTLAQGGVSEPRALLKWPNDVLVSDGKVAGVLVQSRGPDKVVVGVGLNVNTPISLVEERSEEEWPVGPRSLAEVAGRTFNTLDTTLQLVEALVRRLETGLDGPAMEEYRARCHTLGKRVAFTDDGDRMVGTAVDVDPEGGGLLVRLEGGEMRRVTSGEVCHVRSVKG